ncbi:N-terminal domain of NEFA-interacting nuclear protein NIP30-domain-containing protein [Dipodascopsis uninucleata]
MESRFVGSGLNRATSSNNVPVSSSRGQTRDNRSLYDILQDNKAQKQQLQEEQYAQRNQMHRLEDDEIEFLDTLSKKEREKERELKNEVDNYLNKFRERQRTIDKKIAVSSSSLSEREKQEYDEKIAMTEAEKFMASLGNRFTESKTILKEGEETEKAVSDEKKRSWEDEESNQEEEKSKRQKESIEKLLELRKKKKKALPFVKTK